MKPLNSYDWYSRFWPATVWRLRCLGLCGLMALTGCALFYGWMIDAAVQLPDQKKFFKQAFPLARVYIRGQTYESREEIIKALNLANKASLWDVSVPEAFGALMKRPWVRKGMVRQQFPDTLWIDIEEYKPFALWYDRGDKSLITKAGEVINVSIDERFKSLPLVMGTGARFRACDFLLSLQSEPYLYHKIMGLLYVGERRWDIKLLNGSIIKLPEKQPKKAWSSCARVCRDEKLLDGQRYIIDARLPKRLILRPQGAPLSLEEWDKTTKG
jgi:cell division protein FtsQ